MTSTSEQFTPPEAWLGGYEREGIPVRSAAAVGEFLRAEGFEPQRTPEREGVADGARFLMGRHDHDVAERPQGVCQGFDAGCVDAVVVGDKDSGHVSRRSYHSPGEACSRSFGTRTERPVPV